MSENVIKAGSKVKYKKNQGQNAYYNGHQAGAIYVVAKVSSPKSEGKLVFFTTGGASHPDRLELVKEEVKEAKAEVKVCTSPNPPIIWVVYHKKTKQVIYGYRTREEARNAKGGLPTMAIKKVNFTL